MDITAQAPNDRPDAVGKITRRLASFVEGMCNIAHIDWRDVSFAKLRMVGDLELTGYGCRPGPRRSRGLLLPRGAEQHHPGLDEGRDEGGFNAQNVVPLIRDQMNSNEIPMLFVAACVFVGGSEHGLSKRDEMGTPMESRR